MRKSPSRPSAPGSFALSNVNRQSLFFWLAGFAILNYVVLAFWYVGLDNFFSYTEPNISGASWVFMEGGPLYHPTDAATQYSTVYGVYLYIVNGIFLKLLGPSIAATKLGGALSAILSVLGLVYAVSRVTNFRTGVIAGGFLVGIYYGFWPFSTFIARADAVILGMVSLALAAVHVKQRWLCIALAAIALAVGIGVKLHASMYFLPVWALLYLRFGWPAFFMAGISAAALTLAPYVLLSNVSFANHVAWLDLVSKLKFDLRLFGGNLRNMFILQVMPVLLMLSILPRPVEILKKHLLFLGTLVVSLALIMPVASVEGAGKFHLLPFSIPAIYWLAKIFGENYSNRPAVADGIWKFLFKHRLIYVLLLIMALNAFPVNRRMVKLMNYNGRYNGAVEDIGKILETYPDKTIAMGDGEVKDYTLTYFRPLLIFAGNPYPIDSTMVMARKVSGYGLPPKTIEAVKSCAIDIWLLPKDNIPFAMDSVYEGGRSTYPEDFVQAFLANYHTKERIGWFDLWVCKNSG